MLFLGSCAKSPVARPPQQINNSTGNWSFDINSNHISGNTTECGLTNNGGAIISELYMTGNSGEQETPNHKLEIFIQMPDDSIKLGQYYISDYYFNRIEYDAYQYTDNYKFYIASGGYPKSHMVFNITSWDKTTKKISVTFNGVIEQGGLTGAVGTGTLYNITNGKINGTVIM